MKGNLWHPGIAMRKIHVGGDVGGLLFVVASTSAVCWEYLTYGAS